MKEQIQGKWRAFTLTHGPKVSSSFIFPKKGNRYIQLCLKNLYTKGYCSDV